MELKSIGIMSTAKISAVGGLIYGVVAAIVILALGSTAGAVGGMMLLGAAAGIIGAITAIVVGAVGGFVGGAIGAFIYNIIAKYVGGIQLDLK